jgi:hypothetical protein
MLMMAGHRLAGGSGTGLNNSLPGQSKGMLSAGCIENGEIAITRGEHTHIAGCPYRALCCIGRVLFALNRRYLIDENGGWAEAAGFPCTISGLWTGSPMYGQRSADQSWRSPSPT